LPARSNFSSATNPPPLQAVRSRHTHLGKTLADLFGAHEAASGDALVKALKAEKLASVKKKIASHKNVFEEKPGKERKQIALQQDTLAKNWFGKQTKVKCPACESWATLDGTVERVSRPVYEDGLLYEKNIVLANRMECKACGLVLADIDELHIAEIEPHFAYNEATDLHVHHEADFGQEYDNM
jgi:hypothetical protein